MLTANNLKDLLEIKDFEGSPRHDINEVRTTLGLKPIYGLTSQEKEDDVVDGSTTPKTTKTIKH